MYGKERTIKNLVFSFLTLIGTTLLATIGFTDYGAMGVLTVVVFYLFRDFPFTWLFQLVSLFLLNIYFFTGMYIPIQLFRRSYDFETQGFALFALIPIWLYNGKIGNRSPLFKYSMYIFYPVHLLILYLIFTLI